MTTEWPTGLPFDDVTARVDARIRWSKENFCWFVRKALLDLKDELEEEIIDLLMDADFKPRDLLALDLRHDLLLDDVALAEFLKVYLRNIKVDSPPMHSLTTVESLLDHVFEQLHYRKLCASVAAEECAMLQKGLALRARRQAMKEPSHDLVVATYNVNFAFARRQPLCDNTKAVLANVQRAAKTADVLLVQETHSGWADQLDVALARSHPHRLHHLESNNAGGMSVYSRSPVSFVRTIAPRVEGSLFKCQQYAVAVNGQPVHLFNVHLRPPVELSGASGPFSMLQTSPVRRAEVEAIMAFAERSADVPFVIAGDFNENDGLYALSYLSETKQMEDCLGLTDKVTHWWRFRESAVGPYVVLKRLDHIMLSPGLQAVDVEVLDEEQVGSDHFCVIGAIRIE